MHIPRKRRQFPQLISTLIRFDRSDYKQNTTFSQPNFGRRTPQRSGERRELFHRVVESPTQHTPAHPIWIHLLPSVIQLLASFVKRVPFFRNFSSDLCTICILMYVSNTENHKCWFNLSEKIRNENTYHLFGISITVHDKCVQ